MNNSRATLSKEELSMKKQLAFFLSVLMILSSIPFTFAFGASSTTLDYWIAGDVRRTPVYQASVDRFMVANPDITVNITEEVGDNAQIQQKLFTMIASGNAPDVLQVDTMYVADMAKAGIIRPLDDFDGFADVSGSVIAAEVAPLQYDGKTYGLPIRGNSIQLVYNKAMFREAGLDPENPPKTFAELVDAAVKLTKRDASGNIEVYGFETGLSTDSHWTMHVFSPIFWSYGGEYLNADGTSGFASEAGVQALELWNQLINVLKVSPADRITNGFESGKVAMILTGEWSLRPYREDYSDLEVGYATLPVAAEGVTPKIPLGGRACVIPTMSDNADDAWKLIEHVLSYDEQMTYTKAEVGLGTLTAMANDPWFDTNVNYKKALTDMQYAKAKAAPEILQMDTIVFDAIQRVILMGEDPMTALQDADAQYNELLSGLN
jgi:multiple sugar transport system substrate-binding protein